MQPPETADKIAMAHDFIPRRDAEFRDWSGNFVQQTNADPSQWGLTPAQSTQYASLHDAFASAYRIASDPGTRTAPSIMGKNAARGELERYARLLVRIIQATPGVTDQQKVELRITVRDVNPSPVPRPHESPRVFVKLLHGSTVRITLRSADSPRKGKPAGIAGAMVYSFVGDTPPDSLSQWNLEGGTTRTTMDITFGPTGIFPGAKVWITAYWYNPRAQRGPAAQPKSTYIQCPTLLLGDATLRLAA